MYKNPFDRFDEQNRQQQPGMVAFGDPRPAPQPTPQTAAQAQQDRLGVVNAGLESQIKQLQIDKAKRDLANGDPNDPTSIPLAGDTRLTGDDYLKSLPRPLATQVKAFADGRMSPPTGRAAASPYWQRIIQMAGQYDPEFDTINYGARSATRKDFTSGTSARNIKSLNTALGHLGTLADQIDGTASHGGFPFATTVNALENAYSRGTGDPGITNFQQTSGALASELTQVFRGSGGAEADVKRYLEELDPNASSEQKREAVRNIASLLQSRLEAIGDQYKKGMGKSSDQLQLLDPHAQKVLGMFGGGDQSGPPTVGGGGPSGPGGGKPPIDNGMMDPTQNSMGVASGKMRNEYDAQLSGQIDALIRNPSVSESEIVNFVKSKGGTPPTNIGQAREYLRRHPGYKGGFTEAMRPAENNWKQRLSGSPFGAAVAGAGNAVTMGTMDEIAGGASSLMGGDYTQTRDSIDARKRLLAASHPGADLAGNVAGGAMGMIGSEAALARYAPGAVAAVGGMFGRGARVASDAAYGAAYGAGEDNNNRLGGALGGGAFGAGGGALARGVTKGVGSAIAPSGGDMAPLYELKTYPSLGQRLASKGPLGRAYNMVEQGMQSIPGFGILPARARAIPRQQVQIGLFNDSLSDLDPTLFRNVPNQLPKGMKPGTDPHAFASKAFNAAYDQARAGMRFAPDAEYLQKDLPAFVSSLKDGTLDARQRVQVQKVIQNAIGTRLKASGGQLAGDQYKAAAAQLDRTAAAWGRNPNTALQAGALRDFTAIFDNAARRNSAPEAVARLDAADRGYAKLVRIQHASEMAGGEPAQFTPAQYRRAVQKDGGGVRSSAYLQGDALGQRYADAMKGLEDTLPNSGTADRLAIGQGIAGTGAGGAAALGAPVMALAKPGAAMLAPYLPGVNHAITHAMAPRSTLALSPETLTAIENMRKQLQRRSGLFGNLGTAGALDYEYGR